MNKNLDILKNTGLEIENGLIKSFVKKSDVGIEYEIYDFNDYVMLPGFVQTHVHLCQTLFRGMADEMQLLDWLRKRVFPLESAHTKTSLRASTRAGLIELQKSGTTTIMDMGTLNHQEVIFDEMIRSGMRGFAGKCMIDQNDLYPSFCESTADSLNESIRFAEEYHNSGDGRIKYAFAPRFVLSCSENLLRDTFAVAADYEGALFHSHSSENKNEIEEVKKMTGYENIEYFDKIGILNKNTVLAHCIHLNDYEKDLLKESKTVVSHCPSSNLKLGSGIADIPGYIEKGIRVSIGADGAPCNNNLNMLKEMRMASLIQKPVYGPETMDAKKMLMLSTLSGAEALGISELTGSIELGKKADLILMDLNKLHNIFADDIENIYSDIVYSSDKSNIKEVMIDGKWVVRNSGSVIYDEKRVRNEAEKELKNLLEGINF